MANHTPHEFSPEKPKLSRMIETAAMIAPVQSIARSGWAGTFLSRKLSSRFTAPSATMRANDQRQPIVSANQPARMSAMTPASGIAAASRPIALA